MDTLYQAKQTPSYGGKINHLEATQSPSTKWTYSIS